MAVFLPLPTQPSVILEKLASSASTSKAQANAPSLVEEVANFVSSHLPTQSTSSPAKSILIVGAGTAGIGTLLGLLAVPEEYRQNWNIDLVEKRDNVGGVWYAQNDAPAAPELPDTPTYPALHVNTPAPTMTYPGIPFPANTPLFPPHPYLKAYHELAVKEGKLEPYIQLNTTVLSAAWADGRWSVEIEHGGKVETKKYDHLAIANGHFKYPSSPTWVGQEDWLAGGDRKIGHSLWYRGPEPFAGRNILVVGYSASGLDISTQSIGVADKVYHSYSPRDPDSILNTLFPAIPGTIVKPRISHFTADEIVFVDGTTISHDKVTIVLATGYDLLIPFLKDLKEGPVDSSTTTLTTNTDYIRPLHEALFSIDTRFPKDALALISLPWFTANGANAYLQGLYLGHAWASGDGNFLPSAEESLKELNKKEEVVKADGHNPFEIGHFFYAPGQAEAYQENLFNLIRTRSKIPLPAYLQGQETYVEDWRRFGRSKGFFIRKGWRRALELGVGQDFLSKTGTEEDWAVHLHKIEEWEKEQEVLKPRTYID